MDAMTATESGQKRPDAQSRKNAIDLFTDRVKQSGARSCFRWKEGGVWREATWNDWDRASREIGAGLHLLGVGLGDRCSLLANTRKEWLECDVGILMAGGVTGPIYQSKG